MNHLTSCIAACDPRADRKGAGPAGTPPNYLLEMARSFSVDHHSELVLCTHFLPGIDLAVSASNDGWMPLQSSRCELERRCQEVIDALTCARDPLMASNEWCRSALSFGLVRWWPIDLRERAMVALGPFPIVIHCARPGEPVVHVNQINRAP